MLAVFQWQRDGLAGDVRGEHSRDHFDRDGSGSDVTFGLHVVLNAEQEVPRRFNLVSDLVE